MYHINRSSRIQNYVYSYGKHVHMDKDQKEIEKNETVATTGCWNRELFLSSIMSKCGPYNKLELEGGMHISTPVKLFIQKGRWHNIQSLSRAKTLESRGLGF